MTPAVWAIGTAVPYTQLRQDAVRDAFRAQPGSTALTRRLIGATFDAAAIETRYTVIDEFSDAPRDSSLFIDAETGAFLAPGTAVRNAVYVCEAGALALLAAERALDDLTALDRDTITHVVTVSCTGFSAPGLDIELMRGLGLRPSVKRLHVGFMGCYGAFPALQHANAVCLADPSAVVLVVSVELCSLHLHSSNDHDAILSSAVFADGAAAALVSASNIGAASIGATRLEIAAMETVLTDHTLEEMSWTIGDHGFEMVLTSEVPRILEANIASALEPLRRARPDLVPGEWPEISWAIHPGGRSILDRVQHALQLTDDALDHSRAVLRDFGNMSSATVLFVLQRYLHGVAGVASDQVASDQGVRDPEPQQPPAPSRTVCAAAFGPGLTVESALFVLREAP
jgi:predicted naringenin-chalcone synthase